MYNIIFYVMLCTSPGDCNAFEPYSWSVTTEKEIQQAYKECSVLAEAYAKLEATKETDCYAEE